MKKLLALAVVAALVYAVVMKVRTTSSTETKGPAGRRGGGKRAVAVMVKPVTKQDIRDMASFTGTLVPRTRFVVAPKVQGRLEKLSVNIGDTVKKDDLVAVIDGAEYEQQVAQARAEVEVARASLAESSSALDIADREFQRVDKLRQQKVASEAELDAARGKMQAAKARHEVVLAQIRQKEAALKTAEVRLAYTRIHASWDDGDGIRQVAERFVDEGAMLRANDPIVSIVDLDIIIAVVSVIERDYPRIRVGQTAFVTTDAYGDRKFEGTVARKAPVLDENSRQARVEIEIPNGDRALAPGMFVRVQMQYAEHRDVVVVPTDSIVAREGKRGVFIVDDEGEKAAFVPVQTGIVSGTRTEVTSPALTGRVVTLGQHLLEDGGAVVVADGTTETGESRTATGEQRGGKDGQRSGKDGQRSGKDGQRGGKGGQR